jgi:TRAP-type C4-dicarboxylate transport system permease small subunit
MRALEKPLATIATWAGILGGLALVALMLTTVLDVTFRTTFNFAFLGVTEITELGLVVVAIAGIAYCGWTEGHIALEFGERLMSAQAWRGLDVAGRLVSAVVAGTVAFYSFAETAAVYGRNAHTNLLGVPEYPFYLIVGLGFLIYAVILVYRAAVQGGGPQPAGPRE